MSGISRRGMMVGAVACVGMPTFAKVKNFAELVAKVVGVIDTLTQAARASFTQTYPVVHHLSDASVNSVFELEERLWDDRSPRFSYESSRDGVSWQESIYACWVTFEGSSELKGDPSFVHYARFYRTPPMEVSGHRCIGMIGNVAIYTPFHSKNSEA